MRALTLAINAVLLCFPILCHAKSGEVLSAQTETGTVARVFAGNGVILEIKKDNTQVVIRHDAISNYMDAMTMPFNVKNRDELAGLRRGDKITFQLHVTATESWVEQIVKIGTVHLDKSQTSGEYEPVKTSGTGSKISLLDYKFTNELGQAVSLNDFRGQALAITFFYTRCPVPEFCPRLSKNFQEASQKLEAMTNAPSNWHFISVSFDPEFDTPEILKNYASSYHYNPARWSFLTGPPDKIGELARAAGVEYEADEGTINHNFRTLILDAAGRLQMVFPISGDLSDQIVSEIIKAAAITNAFASRGRA